MQEKYRVSTWRLLQLRLQIDIKIDRFTNGFLGEINWISTHGLECQKKLEFDEIGRSEVMPLARFWLEQQGKLLHLIGTPQTTYFFQIHIQ